MVGMRVHHLNTGTMCPHGQRFVNGTGSPFGRARLICHSLLLELPDGLALVDGGVGVAIVPAGSARADPQIAVRPLADVAVTREIGLALRARLPQPIVKLCAQVQAGFATVARAA